MVTRFSVGLLGRNYDLFLLVDLHADQGFIKSLDDFFRFRVLLARVCSLGQGCRVLRTSLLSPLKCRKPSHLGIVRDNVRIRCLLSGPSSQGYSMLVAGFLLRAL